MQNQFKRKEALALRIIRRMRTDSSFVDECEAPEYFNNTTCGLSIAWLCGRIPSFLVTGCSVATVNAETNRTRTYPASLEGHDPTHFIDAWYRQNPSIIIITGKYQKVDVSISVLLNTQRITFEYPRTADGMINPLEKTLSDQIEEHFGVLKQSYSGTIGSKQTAVYHSSLFQSIEDGLLFSAVATYFPGITLRWYGVYLDGIEKTNEQYGMFTSRQRIMQTDFVAKFKDKSVARTVVTMYWRGRHLAISCDFHKKTIQITWDKRLSNDIESFVQNFNAIIYENKFTPTPINGVRQEQALSL